MFVVVHYLEPVAIFAELEAAEAYAASIGGDVYTVPVLSIERAGK